MANNPKKMKDPTEAALSAIQDALTIRDSAPGPEPVSSPAAPVTPIDEPASDAPWRTVKSPSTAKNDPFDGITAGPQEQGALRLPANDDRESIGQILRTLQHRPARTSYMIATIFAVVWVLAGLVLGWIYLPQIQSALGPTGLTAPVLGMLAAIFFAPI
ncbi:MAG TPA: hypothetical protein VH765_10820, partial [Xanthobacteraceae bacterium]